MSKVTLPFLVVFIIIFSCFAYGGTTTSSLTIIQGLTAFMILAWLGEMTYNERLSFVKTGFLVSLTLFIGIIVFQLIPMPTQLIKFIPGNTFNLYKKFIPPDALKGLFCLSIYPNATISELLKVFTYIGMFF